LAPLDGAVAAHAPEDRGGALGDDACAHSDVRGGAKVVVQRPEYLVM
jgi:hypothetical protein